MSQHQIKGILPRLLAEIRQQCDVPADKGLQTGADGAENGARAHDNSSHNSERARYAESIELKLGRNHIVSDHSARAVARCHQALRLRTDKSPPNTQL